MDFIHVLHKQVYILIIGLSELKTNVKNLAQNRWKTPPFNTQKGKVLNIITLYKIIRCSANSNGSTNDWVWPSQWGLKKSLVVLLPGCQWINISNTWQQRNKLSDKIIHVEVPLLSIHLFESYAKSNDAILLIYLNFLTGNYTVGIKANLNPKLERSICFLNIWTNTLLERMIKPEL